MQDSSPLFDPSGAAKDAIVQQRRRAELRRTALIDAEPCFRFQLESLTQETALHETFRNASGTSVYVRLKAGAWVRPVVPRAFSPGRNDSGSEPAGPGR